MRKPATIKAAIIGEADRLRISGEVYFSSHGSILAARLDNILGDKTKRYELCKWFSGQTSTKNMDGHVMLAVLDWLGGRRYESVPSAEAKREVQVCLTEAMEASGIMDMFKKLETKSERDQENDDMNENLAKALCSAQAEMPAVPFDSTNPFFKSRYAGLGSIIETIKPVLAKHSLSYVQMLTGNGGEVGVKTILMHNSGESIESTVALPLPTGKPDKLAQMAGSTITYLRRYSISAMLGLYAEEDNDGNAGNNRKRSPAAKASGARQWSKQITESIVSAEYAKSEDEARRMLNMSVLPDSVPELPAVSWAKYCHAAIVAGNDEQDAANIANVRYTAAMEKR